MVFWVKPSFFGTCRWVNGRFGAMRRGDFQYYFKPDFLTKQPLQIGITKKGFLQNEYPVPPHDVGHLRNV